MNRSIQQPAVRRSARSLGTVVRGFTLVDVLVSLAVMSVLIAILLPSISRVRESAQRVICGSNLRQIGMGLHMYSESSADHMPSSVFLPHGPSSSASRSAGEEGSPGRMDTVRTNPGEFDPRAWGEWDGLGLLFANGYLNASKVFYCPSHGGSHTFERYTNTWAQEEGEIISNFQFRGEGPDGMRKLYQIESSAAIVSDMLRSFEDLNHKRGFNVLKAGLSVSWVEDENEQIADLLLRQAGGDQSQNTLEDAWTQLDGGDADGPDTDGIADTE